MPSRWCEFRDRGALALPAQWKALPPPFDRTFICRIRGSADSLSPPLLRSRRGAQRRSPSQRGRREGGATMAREKWMSALPKRGQRQRCSGGALKSLELHCSRPGSHSSTDLHVCEFRFVPARKNQRIPCLGPQRMIYRGATLRHFFVSRKLRRCRFHIILYL